MKVIEKNKLSKTSLGLIVLSSILALLIVAYVVISIVLGAIEAEKDENKLDIREEIGESSYVGQPLAYDRITEAQITYIKVDNENGTFDLMRYPNDKGEFWFGYKDKNGNETMIEYIPPIVSIENGFDYEELYAIENNDGYGRVYMLSYLCSAVGTLYFNNRIDLPPAPTPSPSQGARSCSTNTASERERRSAFPSPTLSVTRRATLSRKRSTTFRSATRRSAAPEDISALTAEIASITVETRR